jgi:glucokinase
MNIYIPKPSEGGHSDLPIYNDFEMKLALYIKSINKSLNPINYEDVLSGKGIINIYEFIRTSKKFKESKYTKEIDNKPSKSELISKYRLKDKNCKEVFKIFTIFYARCAKNFVLDTLSTGGLFIAGGITNKNREIFHSKIFLNEFNKNTNQSKLLQDIPIYLIIDHNIGLKGACYAAILNDEKQ